MKTFLPDSCSGASGGFCCDVIGYLRGREVVGADVQHASAVLGAVASHQTVSVDTRRIGVGHQLDLHPGVAHVVIDLRRTENTLTADHNETGRAFVS